MPPEKVNSIKLKFPVGFPRPTEAEIAGFLVKQGIEGPNVTAVYPDNQQKCIYVKFSNEDLCKEFLRKTTHDVGFEYSNKVKVHVQVSDANVNIRYVRCFEVEPEINDDEVRKAFEGFGEVKQIVWEKSRPLPGFEVYNGIRGVHLIMSSEVPDLVEIDGKRKRVAYLGMTERCFRCSLVGHKRFQCPKSIQSRLNNNVNSTTNTANLSSENFPALQAANVNNNGRTQPLPPYSTDSDDYTLDNLMTVDQVILKSKDYVEQQQQQTPLQFPNVGDKDGNTTGVQSSSTPTASTAQTKNVFVQPTGMDTKPTHGRSREKKDTVNSKNGNDKNMDAVKALAEAQRAKLRDRSRLGKEANNGNNGTGDGVRSRSNSSSSSKSKK